MKRGMNLLSPLNNLSAIPFTIILLIFIIGIGVRIKIHQNILAQHFVEKFGFSPKDLWNARLQQLFFSLFFTNNLRSFLQAVILIFVTVGLTELRGGTLNAILVFWGIHVATLIILSFFVIFPLYKLKIPWGKEIALVKDVGPSAGYFGCLGFMIQSFPVPWVWLLNCLIFFGLLFYSLMPPGREETPLIKQHADLAHIIAFILGILTGLFGPLKFL